MRESVEEPVFVVAYGDEDTVVNHQQDVVERAQSIGLEITGWYSDTDGLRGFDAPADAPGLVDALAVCARDRIGLLIPFAVDAPGENRWRLIGHWLTTRGLKLFLGPNEFCWCCAYDPIDWAIRQQLDAATQLATAVVARGALPSLEGLLQEIIGDAPHEPTPAVMKARALRDVDLQCGAEVPVEPDRTAPWSIRAIQCRDYAAWLCGHETQKFVAEVLNDLEIGRSRRQSMDAGSSRAAAQGRVSAGR